MNCHCLKRLISIWHRRRKKQPNKRAETNTSTQENQITPTAHEDAEMSPAFDETLPSAALVTESSHNNNSGSIGDNDELHTMGSY